MNKNITVYVILGYERTLKGEISKENIHIFSYIRIFKFLNAKKKKQPQNQKKNQGKQIAK